MQALLQRSAGLVEIDFHNEPHSLGSWARVGCSNANNPRPMCSTCNVSMQRGLLWSCSRFELQRRSLHEHIKNSQEAEEGLTWQRSSCWQGVATNWSRRQHADETSLLLELAFEPIVDALCRTFVTQPSRADFCRSSPARATSRTKQPVRKMFWSAAVEPFV